MSVFQFWFDFSKSIRLMQIFIFWQTFILRVLFGFVSVSVYAMRTKKWWTETTKNYASQNIQFICKHIENLISSNASMILNLFDELERHVYILSKSLFFSRRQNYKKNIPLEDELGKCISYDSQNILLYCNIRVRIMMFSLYYFQMRVLLSMYFESSWRQTNSQTVNRNKMKDKWHYKQT